MPLPKKQLEAELETAKERASTLGKSTLPANEFVAQLTSQERDLLLECRDLYGGSLERMAEDLADKFKGARSGAEVTKQYRCRRDALIIREGFIPYQTSNNADLVAEATKTS